MQYAATVLCILLVAGLFRMDRADPERPSRALWIPLLWVIINGSRPVSQWLFGTEAVDAAHYSEGSPLDAAITAALIVAGLLVLNRRPSRVSRFLQANLPLVLFFAYCIFSTAWSDFPVVAIKRMIKALGDVVMVLMVFTDPYPVEAMKRLLARASYVLLLFSALLILFYPSLGTALDDGNLMYIGVTTQKNVLGQTCMLCGLGLLWILIDALRSRHLPRRNLRIAAYTILLATTVGLIVKSNSMTSLASLLLAGAAMILVMQPWVRASAAGVHAVVGGIVGMTVFATFLDSRAEILHSLGRNATLTGRTEIWQAVLALHTNPAIGTGYESFWLGDRLQFMWDATNQSILQAHNGYLEIYINLGWIGVALLGVLIVTGYRNALASLFRDPLAGSLALGLLAASLITNMTEAGFRMMTLVWFAFLLAVVGIPSSAAVRQTAYMPVWKRAESTRRMRVLQ